MMAAFALPLEFRISLPTTTIWRSAKRRNHRDRQERGRWTRRKATAARPSMARRSRYLPELANDGPTAPWFSMTPEIGRYGDL